MLPGAPGANRKPAFLLRFRQGASQPHFPASLRLHLEAFLHANYRSAPPDPELSGYAHTLVKGQRFQEAINVSAMLENPNTLGALNYRGYAMRKLGRTEAS